MNHRIELSPSGRALCRSCGVTIAKGELRLAEAYENAHADTAYRFHHLQCAAKHLPAALADARSRFDGELPPLDEVAATAEVAVEPPATKAPAKKQATTRPKKTAAPASDVPGFGALDAKQLAALATKINKKKDAYRISELVDAAVGDDDGARVLWHLALHGLVNPATNEGVLVCLGDSAADAPAEALVPVLARLTTWDKELHDFPERVDAIIVQALMRAEPALEAARSTLPPRTRLAVEMARGRSGREIDPADRARVLEALASSHGHGYGIAKRNNYWIVGADGRRTRFILDEENLHKLVACFGDDATWRRALLVAARDQQFIEVRNVAPGLHVAALDECVTLLAGHDSSYPGCTTEIVAVLESRDDAPDALLAATAAAAGKAETLELCRLVAMVRAAARGEEVPPGAEDTLTMEHWDRSPPFSADQQTRARLYGAAFAALGRDRALARARKQLEHDWAFSGASGVLGVHFDEALLAALLDRDRNRNFGGWTIAVAGSKALAELGRRLDAATSDAERAYVERLLRGALAGAAQAGDEWSAEWDRLVDFADASSTWLDADRELILAIMRGLPIARRRAALSEALVRARFVERPFLAAVEIADDDFRRDAVRVLVERRAEIGDRYLLVRALKLLGPAGVDLVAPYLSTTRGEKQFFDTLVEAFGSDAAPALEAALAGTRETWRGAIARLAAGTGPRERVYLLEHELADVAPRPGSWSRMGGSGPAGAPPTENFMHHVLTIDLDEVEELRERFPGARALALYVPDPRSGGGYGRSRLVPVPASANPPVDGVPIVPLAVDVPSQVFDAGAASSTPALDELRGLIFNRPGWVLGQPMWIQEPAEGQGFVMQLSEHLDLNLGDAGALYVFEDCAVMQSH